MVMLRLHLQHICKPTWQFGSTNKTQQLRCSLKTTNAKKEALVWCIQHLLGHLS